MHKVTEIKEGRPCHLHRLIRGGLSPTVASAMTHCPQKGGWQVHRRGKPQWLSLVRVEWAVKWAQVDFSGDR